MQVIEKNSLFAQVSGEQSAVVSGGSISEAQTLIIAYQLGQDDVLNDTQLFNVFLVSLST